jgi:hypothetical protein
VPLSLITAILAGTTPVPLERVSMGHSTVKVTEQHYSPWIRDRQEQLEADLERSWAADPVVLAATKVHQRYTRKRRASIETKQARYFGEPGGTRTRDHRIKSAMLYQLSYRPNARRWMKRRSICTADIIDSTGGIRLRMPPTHCTKSIAKRLVFCN